MKLGFRLLLIVGHTLGDFAFPLMKKQCARAGTSLETMTSADAEQVLPLIERVLSGYVVRPADLAAIMHELRLEVGNERFIEAERDRAAAVARGTDAEGRARVPGAL